MKTIILICTLFLSCAVANDKTLIEAVYYCTAADKSADADTIERYDDCFVKFDANASFDLSEETVWIKIRLKDDLESMRYIASYDGAEFDLSSFSSAQSPRRFNFFGGRYLSFDYQKGRDATQYYIRITSFKKNAAFLHIESIDDFYDSLQRYLLYLLIAGIVLGLILMAAVFNGMLYYYNGEKSFLYYALMQSVMVAVLLFHTGVPQALFSYFSENVMIYEYLSLFAAFFAIEFTRYFLNTREFLPLHDRILRLFLIFVAADMLYYPLPVTSWFKLYSIATFYFLIVGYKRAKQGYKPALFFLAGWSFMVLGIVMLEYFEEYLFFDTLLLGSAAEAIMLAIALSYKIKRIQDEKESHRQILIHQSRLAFMGEMIGNIAHQWRQPLTHLGYIFMNLEEIEDKKKRLEKIKEGTKQLEFMSDTIDDFRDFYAQKREKSGFSLSKETAYTLELIHFGKIEVLLTVKEDKEICNYKNEYRQVLLNLLSNAKEALIKRDIKNPTIKIEVDKNKITIEDNAGGIGQKDLRNIFKPYFSTKENSLGIGLYMSKMIMEKNIKGELSVENGVEGAKFIIILSG